VKGEVKSERAKRSHCVDVKRLQERLTTNDKKTNGKGWKPKSPPPPGALFESAQGKGKEKGQIREIWGGDQEASRR